MTDLTVSGANTKLRPLLGEAAWFPHPWPTSFTLFYPCVQRDLASQLKWPPLEMLVQDIGWELIPLGLFPGLVSLHLLSLNELGGPGFLCHLREALMIHFQITDWIEQEAKVTFMVISPLPQIYGGFWGICSILLLISTPLASWQKSNLQNRQSVQAAQYQQNKQPNQKVGRWPKQTFLQRRFTDG